MNSEVDCMAYNVYHEARNETLEGQLAVFFVTMNRVASKSYPNTICHVVTQITRHRKTGRRVAQFSWYLDGKSDTPYNKNLYNIIHAWVADAINHTTLLQDNTGGALHYHANWMKKFPEWSTRMRVSARIGSHIFYAKK